MVLPWLGMAALFVEMGRAVAAFERLPRYRVEADPFASGFAGPISGYVSLGALLAPFLLVVWGWCFSSLLRDTGGNGHWLTTPSSR